MLNAVFLGAIAQSALLLSGLAVYWVRVPMRLVGWLAGFGAGALISAVAFDLIPQDQAAHISRLEGALWLIIGAIIFIGGDYLVDKRFGGDGTGSALGIVLGAVVDGIPESVIFGIQVALGLPLSISYLFAVWVSNIPQALAPSADLVSAGWSKTRMAMMWGAVVVACGVAAGLGFLAASLSGDVNGARMAALGAGGLLAMLTDSLIPFAYERGGIGTGFGTVVGFAVALML